MDVRLAKPADLEALALMRWEHWVESGADPAQQEKTDFIEAFKATLASSLNQDVFVWCAVLDDEFISHTFIQRVPKVPKPSKPRDAFGYVSAVYTKPSYRNTGVGAEVMKQVKKWAFETDLEFLILWPSEISKLFWKRMGFEFSDGSGSVGDDSLVLTVRPYVF